MKGIQNKKIVYLGNCHTRIRCVIGKANYLKKVSFRARLNRMGLLVTFGELSNDVDTT
jgi:hypothetical protein